MNSLFAGVSAQQLRKAASIKERIDALQHELERILGSTHSAASAGGAKPKRTMSRSAIAKIRAAAKARWAKIKGKSGAAGSGKRRKMSAAGRARLSAMAKARWKKAKAQGKTAL
jgi:hypothetical protein